MSVDGVDAIRANLLPPSSSSSLVAKAQEAKRRRWRTGEMLRFFRKRKRKLAASWCQRGASEINAPTAAAAPSSGGHRFARKPEAHLNNNHNIDNICLTSCCCARAAPPKAGSLIMIMLISISQVTSTTPPTTIRRPPNSASSVVHEPLGAWARGEPSILRAAAAATENPSGAAPRHRRSTSGGDATTRLVAVSGQWVELQCPLAQAATPAGSPVHTTSRAAAADAGGQVVVWRRNGAALSLLDPRYRLNSLNGSLVLAGAQPKTDEGDYECALGPDGAPADHRPKAQGADHWPAAESRGPVHRFQLRLLLPPRLAPFEFPRDAQVGMKLVVTCSALEGQQPVSFVWLKDNQIIWASAEEPKRPTALGAATSSLGQVHGQQLADKLALGSSHRMSLAELAAAGQQQQQVSSRGAASGAGGPAETNQEPLSLLSDPNIRIRQSDDYSILSIERLELKHTGRYTCSAQNEAARASHSSQLLINAPPSLTVEPQDGDLVSGQSSVIDCAASGQPRPAISWLRARESNSGHWDYVPVYEGLRYASLPNGSLAIANVTQREQGYYLCSAKNGFGPEVTKLIKITVHEPARFSSKFQTTEARVEERVSLVCAASGELPIAFEWLDKEGNPIQRNDKRFIIDHEPQDIGSGEPSAANNNNNRSISRLMLARGSRADSGHYTCQASNKYGSDKMVINLLVQDVPDKVTELKVTNVTASTISVRWLLAFNGNSPVTSYLVQYQSDDPLDDLLAASQQQQQPASSEGGGGGGGGSGSQSQVALAGPKGSSKMADDGTTSIKRQPEVASQSPTSALRAALDALNVASGLEMNADEAIDRTLVELTVEQSNTHLVIKDLSPFCVYRLRLAAINKIGLGEFSDWIRAKTEEAPPSGSALKISAAATGPNSIKVTWSPPDRRSWNGQLIGFNIGYRPIDSSFELNKTIEWSPPSFQSIVLNADAKLKSTKSSTEQLSAATSGPSTKSSKSDTAQGSAAPSTSSSSQSKSDATQQSQFILRQHLRQLLALQQQELVAHLTNLQRSTTYLVWIQAINNRGFGPQSHAISIKTLDDVPPSAPAIKVQSTSPSSITVAWSMLSNFISPANQYSLFYRRLPAQTTLQPHNTNSTFAQSVAEHQQLAGGNFLTAGQQQEPGPFIERTMSSQQLMVGGFLDAQSGELGPSDVVGGQVRPTFAMHHPVSAQHYQQFVYTLDQLECGSVYELYMTTRNSVGKSEPSATVTTRTMGEPPLAPTNKNSLFARIGPNEVALNLAAWSTGGCPITHVTTKYKQIPQQQQQVLVTSGRDSNASTVGQQSTLSLGWPITTNVPASVLTAVNGQQLQQSGRVATGPPHKLHGIGPEVAQASPTNTIHLLKGLMPSTAYELEVTAFNAAGHTSAQYEFVTSNANGTRAGFSRKESVFRIDQRGVALEQPGGSPMPPDGGQRTMEQPASFTNQSAAGLQLLPIVLMVLCFVCLLISSAFCYNRLTDSWKSRRGSSSGDESNGGDGRSSSSAIHCHHSRSQNNSSPMSKSSMVWRLTNGNSSHHQHHRHSTYGKTNGINGGPHLEMEGSTTMEHESPSTVHYCMRDPSNHQMLVDGEQKVQPFSQSVSMKDFNLALANAVPPASNHIPPMRGLSSTLNLKGHRHRSLALDSNKTLAGTLRSRLHTTESFDAANVQQQSYSSYGNYGKQKPVDVQDCAYGPAGFPSGANGNQYDVQQQQCNYANDGQQQQETSWTSYGQVQSAQPQYMKHPTTAYAIPAAATNYATNEHLGTYGTNQQLDYGHLDNYGHQNNIDACIQQLIGQQYPQQQEHQQYAVIVPNQHNKCLPGQNEASFQGLQQVDGGSSQQQNLTLTNNGAQSMIDSSSSSSGIDVGHHLDCNSNASQNGYHLTQAPNGGDQQQQQHHHEQLHSSVISGQEIDLKQL